MKYLKYIIIFAAVGSLFSCTKRDFSVETGTTPVQFVEPTMTVDLTQEYNYIPVEMTEQGVLSTYTTFRVVSGSLTTYADSLGNTQTFDLTQNPELVLFTSNDLYVGKFDPEADIDPVTGTNVDTLGNPVLPTNSIEFRIPNYPNWKSVTLTLELTGEYLGANKTVTWNAVGPEKTNDLDITGAWKIGEYDFYIIKVDDTNYFVNFFSPTAGSEGEFPATFDKETNMLTIDNTATIQVDAGDPYGVVDVFVGTFDGQYLDPNTASVWEFVNSDNLIATNGIYIGFHVEGTSYAGWVTVAPGTAGTR